MEYSMRVAINGYGRIGRLVHRNAAADPSIEVVAVNDLTDAETLAHLLKYCSVYGEYDGEVETSGDTMTVDGRPTKVFAHPDPPGKLWGDLGVDLVFESTGRMTKDGRATLHLEAGAGHVLITAPAKQVDITVIYGVSHHLLDPAKHRIVSNGSCTTNCLAPVVKVVNERFGIEHGLFTTIHAITNDQRLLDLTHKDLRRARSALVSMIPTTTGAAKAIADVFPDLRGKLNGLAVRVPTVCVSVADCNFTTREPVTPEAVNAAFEEAAHGALEGVLDFCTKPLVSVDFKGTSYSAIIDAVSTMCAEGHSAKVLAWYDNEYAYARRCVDVAKLFKQ
jgi:glyceraldehyde 3-phosphate dehydrogenase